MKIKGTTEIEVEVTLPEIMKALGNEMIKLSTTSDINNPQILDIQVFEENSEMWVREVRFNQDLCYPVPEKAQDIVKATSNLLGKYREYISQ